MSDELTTTNQSPPWRWPGILVWIWRLLFGSPELPEPEPDSAPRCSTRDCEGYEDPRCQGGNCTACCNEYCGSVCLASVNLEFRKQDLEFKRELLAFACDRFGKAKHSLAYELVTKHQDKFVILCPDCGTRLKLSFKNSPASDLIKVLDKMPEDCDEEKVRQVMES